MSTALRVGLTGGIGSGKSAVTDRLAAYGIPIIDADVVAREIVAPGEPALDAIVERYGGEILSADGSLNRAALRRIVFEDAEERRWLEAQTHPRIGERIAAQLAAAQAPYVVLVSPLLLETVQRTLVDRVIVVDVTEEQQLQRTMLRDDNTEELVRAIMDVQLPRAQRLEGADFVIDNSGDLVMLEAEVEALHRRLLTIATEHGEGAPPQ